MFSELLTSTNCYSKVLEKLEIDEKVESVAQRARRIPHSMTSKVNEKLKEMLEQDIEKAEGATPWVSTLIAIPKKSGDVRLVLDM